MSTFISLPLITVILGGSAALGLAALVGVRMRQSIAERQRNRDANQGISPTRDEYSTRPTSKQLPAGTTSLAQWEIPPHLTDSLREGRCILFLGSALPTNGQLTRQAVVLEVLERLVAADEKNHDLRAYSEHLKPSRPEKLAELVGTRVDQVLLYDTIRSLLAKRHGLNRHNREDWLRRLCQLSFRAAISLEWDTNLEKYFQNRDIHILTTTNELPPPRLLAHNEFLLVKPLGDIRDKQSLILSLNEWERRLSTQPEQARFLVSLLTSNDVLFVGERASVINSFLTALGAPKSVNLKGRYALLPSDSEYIDVVLLREMYNISPVILDAVQPTKELNAFAHQLHRLAGPWTRDVNRGRFGDRIEHLQLENIGPFRHLDLPINRPWTLLLGDNNAGKSTVLRALALGLSGSDADRTAAGTLLRAGAKSGTINIDVGKTRFSTKLVRDRDVVRIECNSLTPVQAGVMLAIGFPPLRGVPGRRITGPQDDVSFAGGDPADLANLVRNDVDDRLSDLQQWLINQWVNAEVRRPGSERTRSTKQLDTLFSILGRLMPGLGIRFAGIDTERWEILVESGNHRVPLGSLSQGSLSTLAWVGTLVRRLYDAGGSGQGTDVGLRPEDMDGVVLIDELDAHLHPEWQRRIIEVIRATFPNIQVVATTHSPLVVGSLQTGEVVSLRRSSSGDAEVQSLGEFSGWRADQILTSRAFGLETSRDEKTQELFDEYEALLGKPERSRDDELRLRELAERLEKGVPRSAETEVEREAADYVDQVLVERLRELPADRRAEISQEALRYLRKISSEDFE